MQINTFHPLRPATKRPLRFGAAEFRLQDPILLTALQDWSRRLTDNNATLRFISGQDDDAEIEGFVRRDALEKDQLQISGKEGRTHILIRQDGQVMEKNKTGYQWNTEPASAQLLQEAADLVKHLANIEKTGTTDILH